MYTEVTLKKEASDSPDLGDFVGVDKSMEERVMSQMTRRVTKLRLEALNPLIVLIFSLLGLLRPHSKTTN
jgi:hypothetical protein